MTELFSTYFYAGIVGSIIILVILLFRPLLRRAPRNILCILWVLAAVRLVVPFQLESRFSLQPSQPATITTVSQTTVTDVTSPTQSNTVPVQRPSADLVQTAPNTSPAVDAVIPEVRPNPEPLPSSPVIETEPQSITKPTPAIDLNPLQIFAAVWLGVALSLLLYSVVAYWILKHKLREAVKGPDGAMESDAVSGAFVLGYFKPRIYLPQGLCEADRPHIFAHEQAHIKRGDNWWKVLGLLCVCIHWYNPLAWLGYTLLCRDIEIACDEQVISTMALSDRKAYSMALLNSQKKMSGVLVYPVAFGEISLKQRIKNVLAYRKPGFWVTLISIVLVAVITVCFMTSPKSKSPEEPDRDKPSTSMQTDNTDPNEQHSSSTELTEPTVTEPPITEPPVTEPSATEPPATEPPATEPPATEPPVTEPPVTEPPVTEPPATEPPKEEPPKPVVTVIAEGVCPEGDTKWKVTSDGVLTITGSLGIVEAYDYAWKEYAEHITSIVVDNGLIAVPSNAFSGMTGVTRVQLGASVKTIYPHAFEGCTNLTSLILPANCQLERIEEYAFSGSGLTSFTSPASLRRIDSYAFLDCERLQTVILQGGVEYIGGSVFKSCGSLKHVTLGESITYMEVAFEECPALETAVINTASGWGLPQCSGLRSVTIGGNVTTIGQLWFVCCTSLSEVIITAPVEVIRSNAFNSCTSLKTIVLPDTIREIQNDSFLWSGITSITFPSSLEKVSSCPFDETPLQEVVFQGDCPELHNLAFSGLEITAYYPSGNATWTADKLQDYGGDITWIPY